MSLEQFIEKVGFQILKEAYLHPSETTLLDPMTKHKVTVCNLFVNHHQSIHDIARALDENYAAVVGVPIERV